MRRLSVLAVVVLCSSAATTQQAPSPPRPEEAAVVEQVRTTMRFENDGTGRREVYMRVKAQSEAGVQQWGQVVFGYNAATERLEIPFVRVRKADGTVVETPSQSVQDLSAPVQRVAPVYTDFRQKHVEVQSFRPGDTLEVSVVTTMHTALAPGQFWTEYTFAADDIVLDEQVDIDVPAARKIILKLRPGFDPVIKESGGRRTYHWSQAHAVREDPTDAKDKKKEKKPSDEPEPAPVRLTSFSDWSEVGSWFAGLERTARKPTPEIQEKARQLIAGRGSDLEKLEALYDFVSKNFRYVSLSLGAGRYQPRAASDVLRDAYGDCKDKHTLLAALIDAAGLRASAVLINSSVKMDPEFPSPSQFDHVITRVRAGGQDVWLDATPEVAPFRLLSSNLRKKQALVAEIAGSHLEETPAEAPMPALTATTVDGALNDAGTLTANVVMTFRGDPELLLRSVFRATPNPQWKDAVQQIANSVGLDGTLSELAVSDPQATRAAFTVAFHVVAERFANIAGQKVDLALPMSGEERLAEAPDPPESGPIRLGSPGESSYKLKLVVPSAAKLRAPVPVSVTRDYGDYRSSYSIASGTLTVQRALNLKQSEVPSARRADYVAFMHVLAADARQHVSVDGTAIAATALTADANAKDLSRRGWEALQAGDYEQAATLLKRAIDADAKVPTARTNLAIAQLNLHQPQAALESLQKQIEQNPFDEYAYFYMGRAYIAQRKFAEAEAAFNKQLEVNPLDKFTPAALGAMYMDQRRYEKAAQAYEKAAAVNPEQASTQVQLGKAYLNLRRNTDALATFQRAVELSASPTTWNGVAYELSLASLDLDRAQQYAESAIASESALSRNLDIDHADARAMIVAGSLAAYWDTLGWVYFAKGDVTTAEKYVAAAWNLSQHAEVGDHLGQVYEKAGRKNEAIRTYAAALSAEAPADLVREHLARLAGDTAKVEPLVSAHRQDLANARTLKLDAKGPDGKKADFLVLFSAPGRVDAVKFVEGDEEMRPLSAALQKISSIGVFPDSAPARILRRGVAACTASGCTFTLLLPEDARPVK